MASPAKTVQAGEGERFMGGGACSTRRPGLDQARVEGRAGCGHGGADAGVPLVDDPVTVERGTQLADLVTDIGLAGVTGEGGELAAGDLGDLDAMAGGPLL